MGLRNNDEKMDKITITFRNFDKNFCDLKWSKRLKEIGIRQDTCFHYVWDCKNQIFEICWSSDSYDDEHYSAFTAQDFIELFPRLFKIARSDKEWKFYCEHADMHLHDDENLANVFARILISITKNKGSTSIKGLTILK
jgi:hypothetical protein